MRIGDLNNGDSDCKYEALSYEWGKATNTSFSIMVGGMRVKVRESLVGAVAYQVRARGQGDVD